MKNSFEAKARAYGWHLSYVQVYLRKRKNPLFGSNRTKRKPALPSLYIEGTKVLASNTNLERDEMIESVDTESAEELWIQIENAICERTEPTGAVPLHQSMFRSNRDHGIVTQVSCNTCAPFFPFHSSETIQSILLLLS